MRAQPPKNRGSFKSWGGKPREQRKNVLQKTTGLTYRSSTI
jgi:hypothetical protein